MRNALHPRGHGYRWLLAGLAAMALVAAPAAVAQNPTGTLTGTVTGPDGDALPGRHRDRHLAQPAGRPRRGHQQQRQLQAALPAARRLHR